jgi:hypothetical protein
MRFSWWYFRNNAARTLGSRAGRKTCPSRRLLLEMLEERTLLSIALNAGHWTAVGPAPIGSGTSAVSGRITALAADPSNASIYYAGAAGGGVWKTTNAGVSWKPLTDTQAVLFMGALAVAPSNSSIIYAGTGEPNNSLDSNYGRGILKSTNGGTTWTLEAGPFNQEAIDRIVVDPANANIVYVAVSVFSVNNGIVPTLGTAGIWKSTDGGTSWTNLTSGIPNLNPYDDFSDLVMDPTNSQTLYTAVGTYFGDTANGIYKSIDGGNTWSLAGNSAQGPGVGRISLAIAKSAPDTLYAGIANPNGGQLLEMLKTTNGGSSWSQLSGTPNYMGANGFGQGWYDNTVAVDPSNANIVYAGGSSNGGSPDFIQSIDGGVTWTNIQTGANGARIHSDDHAIVFDASGRLVDGNDGGVWRLATATPGHIQWTDLNATLQITQFTGVALNPQTLGVAYGGSQDNGTEKYTGTKVWQQVLGGDGGFVRVDFTNPNTVYSEFTRISLVRSDNGGSTWNSVDSGITGPSDFYVPYVMDPSNSSRLVLGTNQVWVTTNKGTNWTAISTPNSGGWTTNNPIDALAIAPSDPNTIYATTGGDFANPGSANVYVTHNDGVSWTAIGISGFNDHFSYIAVDRSNSSIAYIVRDRFTGSQAGHVFKTTTGGTSWTDISTALPDTPTYSIALDTRSGTVIYVGTDIGVYASANGGTSWVRFKTGMPNAEVRELEVVPNLNVLAAGTHGRGLWEIATTHFKVTSSVSTVSAGTAFTITVTAQDPFSRTMTGYLGTVQLSSTDPNAVFQSSYTFTATDHGKHVFTFTLNTTGTQTVTVKDQLNGAVIGSVKVTVTSPSPAPLLAVRPPGSAESYPAARTEDESSAATAAASDSIRASAAAPTHQGVVADSVGRMGTRLDRGGRLGTWEPLPGAVDALFGQEPFGQQGA